MLKKSASGVLTLLRGSTYGGEYGSPLRSLRPCARNDGSRRVWVGRVKNGGLFKHPAMNSSADHAPVTGSVLCGARPGRSYRNGTAGCADRRGWIGMGDRYLSSRDDSMGIGHRIDRGCRRWSAERLSDGAALAQVIDY